MAREYLGHVIPETLDEKILPDRTALLIVDMNRSHLDHSIGHLLVAKPDADRIIERAVRLRDAWGASGRPVIFVRTHHRYDPVRGETVDNKNPFWMAQHGSVVPGLNKPRKTLAIEGAPVTEIAVAAKPAVPPS